MLRRHSIGVLLLLSVLATSGRTAYAETTSADPVFTFGGSIGPRLVLAPSEYREALKAYSFDLSAPLLDLEARCGYRPIPWLELGGVLTYLYNGADSRAPEGTGFSERLNHHGLEVAGYVRAEWRGRRLRIGLELEVGPHLVFAVLRDHVATSVSATIRPALVVAFSPEPGFWIELLVGHSFVLAPDATKAGLDGLVLLWGINFDVPLR